MKTAIISSQGHNIAHAKIWTVIMDENGHHLISDQGELKKTLYTRRVDSSALLISHIFILRFRWACFSFAGEEINCRRRAGKSQTYLKK
jgi:hypothetical protein